jgi:alpha-2-macroglobulin
MKTKFFLLSTAILVGMAILHSCGYGKPELIKVDPAYGKFVSGYSSGMISRQTPIRVELSEMTLKPELRQDDKELLKEIFRIEPAIDGEAVWVGERTIEFRPKEMLPVNQFFTIDFDLERVAEVEKGYERFRFQVATYSQQIRVNSWGLSNYSDYDLETKYLKGIISTTDKEDTTLLKKTLKFTHNGKDLKFRLEEAYETNAFYFYVDSIKRLDKQSELSISWDGSPVNSISKGQMKVEVPALGDFYLSSARVFEEDDQYIELSFTEPIASEQDLKGLIRLQGEEPDYSIEGEKVTLFLPKRVSGTRKLEVFKGIRNIQGHKLINDHEQFLSFEDPKPNVRIIGKGNILPNSQGLIFPFESIGLKSVDVRIVRIFEQNVHHFLQVNDLDGSEELTRFGKVLKKTSLRLDKSKEYNPKIWNRHVLDLGKFISPQPGAIYRVSIKFSRKDAVCDCPAGSDDEEEQAEENGNWNEYLWHSWGFEDGFDSWYYYENHEESPCSNSYYYGKAVSRNILASDLGMVFKLDDNKTGHVFVNNMLNTEPVANAQVDFYTYAKELIVSGKTDALGMMEVKLKEKPFLMVARYGEQRGYLKLRDGNTNSLSKFDVDGEMNQSGVRGFIYGERGVWRPGDSLYLCFMLGDRFNKLPKDHPVEFELQDPSGQSVFSVTKAKNVNGIYDFRTKTEPEAMTGTYTAIAKVGNHTYYKSVKIETIKPNRLKIEFKNAEGNDTTASLKARWLHGATAGNLRATINVGLQVGTTVFQDYKGFVFDSPLRNFKSEVVTVFEGRLNEKGEANPKTRLQIDEGAPGKLKASYVVKVFEEGGDFSIDRFQDVYSPYTTYVGLKTPKMKEYDESLITDQMHKFEVVTLSEKGNPKDCEKVQVRIYKLKWRWWYERDEEDLYSYISRSGTIAVKDTMISTKGGKGAFHFRVKYPEYGRYLITLTDMKGNHQTGKIINVDWPYWSRGNRSENEQAKMMNFSSDKTIYVKGEKVKLSFPSPEGGRALVSIENGRKVLKKFWVKTVAGETTCEFVASEEMTPSAYVHVTMIQPHASTKNDLPIRMYGIIPIRVDDPSTHLTPEIITPDVIRPESKATVKIKERSGKAMTYTLAIVDEGLLDLTRFATPQPWNTFYAKEALGVKTWDMYDEVIGAYGGRLDNLLSIGGDGSEEPGSGPKANRFKPMVRFIGPFNLSAGQTRSHQIDVPNYIGSVRIMVVAHDNSGAYGNEERSVFVRKPLMLLTSLPRVLGPGEELDLPVTVFAMENHVRKVNVSLESNAIFEVLGSKSQELQFSENGDKIVNFRIRTKKMIGIGELKVSARSGNETAKEELEIDIRPSNPLVVETVNHTIEKGAKLKLPFKLFGMLGTNKVVVEVSEVPSIALEKRLGYLITYPHGCLEQTTSAAFPQLFISSLTPLNENQKVELNHNVQKALEKLQQFQTSSGGFAYWPGEGRENEWGSSYAGHFLAEAENMGFKLPSGLKDRWIAYQQTKAKNWTPGTFYGRQENDMLNQAYRLYTLALAGKAELGAMNRLREQSLTTAAKWRLASAYALAGQKDAARKLISGLSTDVEDYRELSGSFGSGFRDQAMVLEALSILGEDKKADVLVRKVAEQMRSSQWMSTQETAYGLLAVCAYTGKKGASSGPNFSYKLDARENVVLKASKPVVKIDWKGKDLSENKSVEIRNEGSGKLFVTYTVQGIPLEGQKGERSSGIQMKIAYTDLKGNTIDPSKLEQGMEFQVAIHLKNTSKKQTYKELSLSQVFPSGWEVNNSRMDGMSTSADIRYQDFRDDRVYSYLDLGPQQSKTIVLTLNASFTGRFYLPGTFVSAMYDEQISALQSGKWIEVVKQK